MIPKILVTGLAAVLVVVHLAYPEVEVDLVTVALLMVGLTPWLAPIIKSLELPGGIKIELQDVQRATQKVTSAPPPPHRLAPGGQGPGRPELPGGPVREAPGLYPGPLLDNLNTVARTDPNLALVGLRIEIERLLNAIARGHEISKPSASAPAGVLLRSLQKAGVLPPALASGLRELIDFGNRAAHGAEVSREAAEWALERAPEILDALTDYLGD